MQEFTLTFFLRVDIIEFIRLIYIFLFLIAMLFSFILYTAIHKKRIEKNKKSWQQIFSAIISQAILFSDEKEEIIGVPVKIKKLLKRPLFRQFAINELIDAKKNLSGESTLNLIKLYETLQLHIDSCKKLHDRRWHIKAKGIQELGIMDQRKYINEIFSFTNHPNELVRNEAQCLVASLCGFNGMQFLDVTDYPISQLQQIQLLNKLKSLKPKDSAGLRKWLRSSNESVSILAIKLATFYNCYELYDDIINCLQSSCPDIKLNVLEYMKKVPREDSPGIMVSHYFFKNKLFKLAVIDALKDIGSENEISFLLNLLYEEDNEIKAAAAKSLSVLHPSGTAFLQTSAFADQNPWKEIFMEIKNERAA